MTMSIVSVTLLLCAILMAPALSHQLGVFVQDRAACVVKFEDGQQWLRWSNATGMECEARICSTFLVEGHHGSGHHYMGKQERPQGNYLVRTSIWKMEPELRGRRGLALHGGGRTDLTNGSRQDVRQQL